ncbi:glycosyltransferase family 2 protein [Thermophilibacter sp.]
MSQPLVSFIVPVHNGENTVVRCLNSIFSQDVELEVIVIDDGSDDNTLAVLESIVDFRLKVLKREQGGAASARNAGVRSAQGRYIAFVDCDDWVDDGAYRDAAHVLAAEETDLFLLDSSKVFPDGSREDLGNGYAAAFGDERLQGSDIRRCAARLRKMPAAPWDKIIRREFALAHPFPEGRLVEDLDWSMRILVDAQSIKYLPVNAYSYRQSTDSTSAQREAGLISDYLWFFDGWIGFEGDEATEGMVRRFLTTQMFVFLGIFGQAEPRVRKQFMTRVKLLFSTVSGKASPLRREEKLAFALARILGVSVTSKLLASALDVRTKSEQDGKSVN